MRTFDVVVLGAGGVGKSALTVRFMSNAFVESYDPTIEELYQKTITVDGQLDELRIMDTAGTEQFKSLSESYIKIGRGFVLVFSLTAGASWQEVDELRNRVLRVKGGDARVPMVVVGTKLDLVNEREVTPEAIQRLTKGWGVPFFETSAKRNWHVTDVFEDLLRQMRRRYPTDEKRKRLNLHCMIM